jgi:hypothetical protein
MMDNDERLAYNAKSHKITIEQAQELDQLMSHTPMKDFPVGLKACIDVVVKRVGASGDVFADTIGMWLHNNKDTDATLAAIYRLFGETPPTTDDAS